MHAHSADCRASNTGHRGVWVCGWGGGWVGGGFLSHLVRVGKSLYKVRGVLVLIRGDEGDSGALLARTPCATNPAQHGQRQTQGRERERHTNKVPPSKNHQKQGTRITRFFLQFIGTSAHTCYRRTTVHQKKGGRRFAPVNVVLQVVGAVVVHHEHQVLHIQPSTRHRGGNHQRSVPVLVVQQRLVGGRARNQSK
jgi:hypothetical protein